MNEQTKTERVETRSDRDPPLLGYIKTPRFKRLLSDIVAAQHERDFRSLAVLSRSAGEGKTFLASVLALGYATFLRRRVLILDTITQGDGGELYLGEVLREVATGGAEIDIVTSRAIEGEDGGPSSEIPLRFPGVDFGIGDFLERVSHEYDLVVVDTCAITETTSERLDPIIVARQTDTAVLVTSKPSLDARSLESLGRELRARKVDLLGTIHNGGGER